MNGRPLFAPCVCQICDERQSDPTLDGLSYWDDDKSPVLTCRECYDDADAGQYASA